MPRSIPPADKVKAVEMRREGYSIRRIAEQTGMAKSTVSVLVRDVALSDEQREALSALRPLQRGHLARSRQCRADRRGAQLMGRALAQLKAADYHAGVMLYWAEGSKSRNHAGMTNADPDLLRYWLDWLETWHADRAEATLSVNCFLGNGLELEEIETWWLEQLRLPRSSLRKATINNASTASRRVRRPLLYGTAHVRVHSTFVVQSIYGAIQEIAGVERPEWLDLEGAMPESP